MTTFFIILHVMISLLLIFVVLIQGGKGAEMGAAFGGSSQTVFGSRGAATFLNKLTTFIAFAFMATSLILAVTSSRAVSVIKQTGPAKSATAPMTAPVAPATMPIAPPAAQQGQSAPATAPVQQKAAPAPIPAPTPQSQAR